MSIALRISLILGILVYLVLTCGPAHNTWPALPGTVHATAVGKRGRWRMHQRVGRLLRVKVVRVVTPTSPLAPVASPDGPGSG